MNKRTVVVVFVICLIILTFSYLYGGSVDLYTNNHDYRGINSSFSNILSENEKEWLEKQGSLIYAADRNAPPLRFVDSSDNQYKGVVVDYINSLSLELGTEIKLVPLLWEDALNQLAEGKTDICDMFASEERSKKYYFTKPIYNLRAVLAVRSDEKNASKFKDINNLVIATPKGDYADGFIKKEYPKAELRYVPDVNGAVKLLAEGKVDAIAGDEPVVSYFINKNNLKDELKIFDRPLYEEEVVFAVPKSKPELVTILNKGIDAVNKKGQLEKIQQKWFGISAPIVTPFKINKVINYIVIFVVTMLLIVLTMLLLNRSLKRQVSNRTKELEDSKNDLQIIFDGITDYMIVVDKERRMVNVNKMLLSHLNMDRHEIIGRECSFFLNSFCNDCENCLVSRTFETGNSCKFEAGEKNEVYEISSYPLTDSRGSVKNVLIVIHNITGEKISKNQMLQANKMIAVGQLAAGVAHEIRNPLGIIRTHSYILRMYENADEGMRKSLDFIDTAVQRASNIIDNLLNFSRISGNTCEWINMKSFISGILDLQHKLLQKSNIVSKLNCDEELKFFTNQESLKHILINLISNSVDAMEDSGELQISVESDRRGILLQCTDTGSGIKKDDIEKIFNPFYTTKGPGKGTGLGLYIVYNEVKKLNGSINVESELHKGTSFSIYLPEAEEAF